MPTTMRPPTSAALPAGRPGPLGVILRAGLACGVLDISAAFITWSIKANVTPARILKGIASALIGPSAFQGGWAIAALGLTLYFFIALSAATVFYAASRKWTLLIRRPVVMGAFYGVGVYVVMYWVVMPLSVYRRNPFSLSAAVIAIVTHIFCVGLPISLVVRRYSR